MNNIKSGWKTTEFWGSVAVGAAVVITSIEGSLPPKYAALAGTLVAGLYSLSRGLAKLNAAFHGSPKVALEVKGSVSPPAAPVGP